MTEDLYADVLALGLPEVGRSTLGRSIVAACLGDGPRGVLVIVGGVHGDEPTSVAAAVELCRTLTFTPPTLRQVIVLPLLNPDGLVAHTKNSARDVDLNRNFAARNFQTAHESGYFPGISPLSEPETHALVEQIELRAPAGVVAVHAPLACVNYDGPAAAWAEEVSAACGWPARSDIGYATPGSLGSWLGVDRGVPVLTLELPNGSYDVHRTRAQAALQTAINSRRIG